MGHNIPSVIIEHLDFFQSSDVVKVYYDNGQDIVKQALDRSDTMTQSEGTETTGAPARDRGSGLRQCC